MRGAEKLLLEPWQSGFRVCFGFALLPVVELWPAANDSIWELSIVFLGALLALRIALILPRRLLPFSKELKTAWYDQRQLAKRFDSYQWAKLLWIGIGMAAYIVSTGRLQGPEGVLTLGCIGAGSLGTYYWWRARAGIKRRLGNA